MKNFILNKTKLILWLGICLGGFAKSAENTFTVKLIDTKGAYAVLLPDGFLPVNSQITTLLDGVTVASRYYIGTTWPNTQKNNFIRHLLIQIDDVQLSEASTLTIKTGLSETRLRKFFGNPKGFTVTRPKSLSYLDILFRTPLNAISPLLLKTSYEEISEKHWYRSIMEKEAAYIIQEDLLLSKGYPKDRASQWLYDRPRALYQLYFLTGKSKYFIEAYKAASFYGSQINEDGFFKLKLNDLKYLMAGGLYYHYLITLDAKTAQLVEAMFQASLNWNPRYDNNRGFWTERHQAAALDIALNYYKISGSEQARKRIQQIIEETHSITIGNTKSDKFTCPAHTKKAHEGKGGDNLVCSPWMMALLADGLWQYWKLSKDTLTADLLIMFANFIAKHGFYEDTISNRLAYIPYYLVDLNVKSQSKANKWTDVEHDCDVSGMLGKALFVQSYYGEPTADIQNSFERILAECKYFSERKLAITKKTNYAEVKPPRKFGWRYSTTSEIPMLESLFSENDVE